MIVNISSDETAALAAVLTIAGGWLRWAESPTKQRLARVEAQVDAIYNYLIPEPESKEKE